MSQSRIQLQQPFRLSGEFLERRRKALNSYHFRTLDGQHLIIKNQSSQAQRRRLASEWITNRVLAKLGFIVPNIFDTLLPINNSLKLTNPDMPVLAIRFPCDPDAHPIFDMMPDALGHKISNPGDFVGIQLADWWLCNTSSRHALFVRGTAVEPAFIQNINHLPRGEKGYVGIFVGNGDCFGGSDWDFARETQNRHIPRPWTSSIPLSVREHWAGKINQISEPDLAEAIHSIPQAWVSEKDLPVLDSLKNRLLERARHLDTSPLGSLRKPAQRAVCQNVDETSDYRAVV